MIFRNYNDYEIINLIKEGYEEAFELLVEKYRFLIAKKIKSFNLGSEYEDCFQEGLMILYRSAMKFDEGFNKTFTRYFENNFHNYLITYKEKKIRLINFNVEKLPLIQELMVEEPVETMYLDQEIFQALNELSEFEKQVYQSKIIEKRTVRECAYFLNCDEKRVYNALARIRNKIKLHLMT